MRSDLEYYKEKVNVHVQTTQYLQYMYTCILGSVQNTVKKIV